MPRLKERANLIMILAVLSCRLLGNAASQNKIRRKCYSCCSVTVSLGRYRNTEWQINLKKKKKRKTLKLTWSFYSRRHQLVLKSIITLTEIFLWTAEKKMVAKDSSVLKGMSGLSGRIWAFTQRLTSMFGDVLKVPTSTCASPPPVIETRLNKFSCNWVWSLFPIIALCWVGIFSRNMYFHVSFSMISVNFSKGGGPPVVQKTPCSLCHSHYKPKKQDRYSI